MNYQDPQVENHWSREILVTWFHTKAYNTFSEFLDYVVLELLTLLMSLKNSVLWPL